MNSARVLKELKPLRDLLLSHKIYKSVNSIAHAQVFMKSHVYAVWDFMSLLKSMQTKLTVTSVPWVPCPDRISAYFVNSIVLTEESDNFSNNPEQSMSHFELYLEGMKELGGFSEPIEDLLNDLKQGVPLSQALSLNEKNYSSIIPSQTFRFVEKNLRIAKEGSLEQVTAFFLFGREDPIPDMFQGILNEIDSNLIKAEKFKIYLNRHVQLDRDDHGPISMKIMNRICGDDEGKWNTVLNCAKEAIQDRIELWNGIEKQINQQVSIYEVILGKEGIDRILRLVRERTACDDERREVIGRFLNFTFGGPIGFMDADVKVTNKELGVVAEVVEELYAGKIGKSGLKNLEVLRSLGRSG